jgi:hypothetical protein
MRLGKEEAVGYVEDTIYDGDRVDETETASLTTEETTTSQPRQRPLTEPAEPALPVG